MKVLVDTSIWSLALRRRGPSTDAAVRELQELIKELRVQMIGPIRQELLSGIRVRAQFARLRDHLRAFSDLQLDAEDYERAAEFYNRARSKGIQGSNTNFLICAVADRRDMSIFTTDADFGLLEQHFPIRLHHPRPASNHSQ